MITIPNLRFAATLLALGATVSVAKLNGIRPHKPLAFPISSVGRDLHGWTAVDSPAPEDRILKSLGATSFLSRTYTRGTSTMDLWIAYYANQQAGETMHSPKYCVPGAGWEFVQQDAGWIPGPKGPVSVNDYLLLRSGERMRMLYWYQSPRRVVASEYFGKLALIWDALRYGQTSGSIVRITLPDGAAAHAEGIQFAADVLREVDRCFGN